MRHDNFSSLIHWAWLIPAFTLGLTIWCKLIFGHSIWQDFVVIISCLLIVSYWVPLVMNWGGFADSLILIKQSKTKKDLDANQIHKKLRIIGILISVSMLMIAISRTILLILGED